MLETRADLALGVLDELASRHEKAQQRIRRLSTEEADVRTGVTPEAASTVMSRLRAEKIVDSARCWTVILDRRLLTAAAGN